MKRFNTTGFEHAMTGVRNNFPCVNSNFLKMKIANGVCVRVCAYVCVCVYMCICVCVCMYVTGINVCVVYKASAGNML